MKCNYKLLALALPYFLLTSFQTGNVQNLTCKWQAVNIIAPAQDSMMRSQVEMKMQQIDELYEVDSSMVERFHTTDLTTIKKMAKEELAKQPEQMKQQMKDAAADFSFELMKSGTAVVFRKAGNDTVNWYLGDNSRKLFLDPFGVKSNNPMANQNVMIFDIIRLDVDSMRLRVHQPVGNDVFVDLVRSSIKKKN
jgi:hypothetical protein